jgi:hypothetical protein
MEPVIQMITMIGLTLVTLNDGYKYFPWKSDLPVSSCIVPQLITVVGLNIFLIVFKELYFPKTKADKT